MKNLVSAALLCVLFTSVAALTAPALTAQDKEEAKPPRHQEYAYYPLKEGHRWVYQVSDNKAKDARPKEHVVITVADKDTYPIKVKTKDVFGDTKEFYVGFKLELEKFDPK